MDTNGGEPASGRAAHNGDADAGASPRGSDRADGRVAERSRKSEKKESSDRHREHKEHKDRRSSRSRERRRSRSRDRSKKKERSRSRSRERRHKQRSRSRDRRGSRRDSRSRSRSRERRKSSRSSKHESSKRSPSRSQSPTYGGYQPRRRQEPLAPGETAPAVRPSAFAGPNLTTVTAGPNSSTDPFAYLRQKTVPMDQNEALRLWQEQQLQARQLVLAQQAASAAQAATKTQREIYVGNLVAGLVTDAALRQVFNGALMAAFPGSSTPGMEPVVNVSLHSDGRYAFVELRTPDMATAALQLNGVVQLMGQSIAVNRPSGYVDPMKAHAAALSASQALAAFKSGDPATNAMLTSSLAGMPGAAGTGALYGVQPGMPAAGLSAALALPQGMVTALPGMLPGGVPGLPYGLPPAPAPLAPVVRGISSEPTPYICVTGMVTADVLQDDRDYEDVREELEEECNRHAANSVVAVKVPRPPPEQRSNTAFMGVGDYGKAFVHFRDATSASAARAAIHGRLFAGVTVNAVFITAQAFTEAAGGA